MLLPIKPITCLSLVISLLPIPNATPGIKNTIEIIATIESMKGDFNISPVSGFLSAPVFGTTSIAITIANKSNAIPANFNPLFSSGVISVISSVALLPFYSPSLGSTIFSVTIVPTIVIKIVDAIKKYQFEAIPTSYPT